ncbi:MAG: helix-turn-helix transcriptional regulator [Bacillota bacterium]|nr:helix-turn-helix transcriptional regulator [Bacillota bacterium]
MRNAYNELYLRDAMTCLGEMFDEGINSLGIDPDEFYFMFLATGYASRFGNGDPDIIAGKSGLELAYSIARETGLLFVSDNLVVQYDRTPEYWAGWILAYYQFVTGYSFRYIHDFISMKEIIRLYYPLHEAEEERAIEAINNIVLSKGVTSLQRCRKRRGLSQSELAKECNISLRTEQQYENNSRQLLKASYEMVSILSEKLNYSAKDLVNEIQ